MEWRKCFNCLRFDFLTQLLPAITLRCSVTKHALLWRWEAKAGESSVRTMLQWATGFGGRLHCTSCPMSHLAGLAGCTSTGTTAAGVLLAAGTASTRVRAKRVSAVSRFLLSENADAWCCMMTRCGLLQPPFSSGRWVGLARTQRGRVCTVLPAVLCNRRAQVSGDKRAPTTYRQPTLHPAIMLEPSLLLHVLTCPDYDACFLLCAFRLFYESFPMLKEPLRRARERRKDAGLRASVTLALTLTQP